MRTTSQSRNGDDPIFWPATRQRDALERHEISCVELLALHLDRVASVNPAVNAIVSFVDAHETASEADASIARDLPRGPLHGLPLAFKDTDDALGMPTTFGSPLFRNTYPASDSLAVGRVRQAGAIVIGKTNVPEFAAGSHTVNPLFGATRNPFDLSRSAGGSSGGAAAALATGMVSLATGSDMGGSLRNPASFCNVVGIRPSAGRVPSWPSADAWQGMLVSGPMARTVQDAALLLAVMAGEHPRSPLSLPGDGSEFFAPLDADLGGIRVGWSRTLGGLDIEPAVTGVLDENGRAGLREVGARLVDVEPNIGEFDDVFRTLRAIDFADGFGAIVDAHRDELGPLMVENVDLGRTMILKDFTRARARRTELYHRFDSLFGDIDVLASPAVAVVPFDIDEPWVRSINGVRQPDYLEWMRTAWRITPTGFTAMSVPCGFTPDGLPVGMQLIARPRSELVMLRLAHEFERRRPFWREIPAGLGLRSSA
ncbi:MAG: amidase family protein [Mycetocola sp.]